MNNTALFRELEHRLQREPGFCTSEGVLIRNAIAEAAMELRPELLRLLLGHEELRAFFFAEVEGVMIFDKVKFLRFVSNKNFLPDSFTAYRNRIGLADGTGDMLAERRQVVLSWPYKDCLLEGGQTREEARREEIFWNETLAPDEINRLTEPKALSHFHRVSTKVEQSNNRIFIRLAQACKYVSSICSNAFHFCTHFVATQCRVSCTESI